MRTIIDPKTGPFSSPAEVLDEYRHFAKLPDLQARREGMAVMRQRLILMGVPVPTDQELET